jgi:hypothetical protein
MFFALDLHIIHQFSNARFLIERTLDISLLWLPMIKQIVDRKMCEQKHRTKKKNSVERKKIYLAIDRTQWPEVLNVRSHFS